LGQISPEGEVGKTALRGSETKKKKKEKGGIGPSWQSY